MKYLFALFLLLVACGELDYSSPDGGDGAIENHPISGFVPMVPCEDGGIGDGSITYCFTEEP